MLTCYLYFFFDKVTVQLFSCYFFLCCLFSSCLIEFFICCGNIFIRYLMCKYFLLAHDLNFHSFNGIFHREKDFNFDEVQLTNFFLYAFSVISKHSLPNPRAHRFLLMFSSKSFITLF